MKQFAVGLLFDASMKHLALCLHEPRACWCAPLEEVLPEETSAKAVERLFLKEVGVAANWTPFFVLLKDGEWQRDFFWAADDAVLALGNDALIKPWPMQGLPVLAPNLDWIIPFATSQRAARTDFVRVYEIQGSRAVCVQHSKLIPLIGQS